MLKDSRYWGQLARSVALRNNISRSDGTNKLNLASSRYMPHTRHRHGPMRSWKLSKNPQSSALMFDVVVAVAFVSLLTLCCASASCFRHASTSDSLSLHCRLLSSARCGSRCYVVLFLNEISKHLTPLKSMKRVRASLTFASMRYMLSSISSQSEKPRLNSEWIIHQVGRMWVWMWEKWTGPVGWGSAAEQRRWKDECVASGTRGDFVVPWGTMCEEDVSKIRRRNKSWKILPRFPCALWQCFMKNRRHMVCSLEAWWEKFWIFSLSSRLLLNLFLVFFGAGLCFLGWWDHIKLFACCLGKLFGAIKHSKTV